MWVNKFVLPVAMEFKGEYTADELYAACIRQSLFPYDRKTVKNWLDRQARHSYGPIKKLGPNLYRSELTEFARQDLEDFARQDAQLRAMIGRLLGEWERTHPEADDANARR